MSRKSVPGPHDRCAACLREPANLEWHHPAGRANVVDVVWRVCVPCHNWLTEWQRTMGIPLDTDAPRIEATKAASMVTGLCHVIALSALLSAETMGPISERLRQVFEQSLRLGRSSALVMDILEASDAESLVPDPVGTDKRRAVKKREGKQPLALEVWKPESDGWGEIGDWQEEQLLTAAGEGLARAADLFGTTEAADEFRVLAERAPTMTSRLSALEGRLMELVNERLWGLHRVAAALISALLRVRTQADLDLLLFTSFRLFSGLERAWRFCMELANAERDEDAIRSARQFLRYEPAPTSSV
jgi:hypothetical protein